MSSSSNTVSAELISSSAEEDQPSNLTKVLCDACVKKASVKSCLNCGMSFCGTHIKPHHNIQILQKHKLIVPVKNLDDYMCQKHERPLELFCRDDQTCVCKFCTETDHKTHNTVPIEEESGEKKTQLKKTQTHVQKMIQDRLEKTEEIKHSLELSKTNTDDTTESGVEVFTALMRSIERSQAELLKVMEEKQRAAEKQAEDLIKDLEQEITELKRRDTELEQISHTEDHLHLLQVYPSLCRPPHSKDWTDISLSSHSSKEVLRTSLSQFQESLDKEIQKLKPRILLKHADWRVMLVVIIAIVYMMLYNFWVLFYAVDVTLDPDTANAYLILSTDGKQVRYSSTWLSVPYTLKRFKSDPYVLAREGFSSGRFYYEVQVSGKTDWDVGVARESISRWWPTHPNAKDGTWTVILRNGIQYKACAGSCVILSLREKLQSVGVFVDYEKGLVSFYDVKARSHICSFTGQSFTEKLYPFFCPGYNEEGKNSAPLIISPVYKGLTTLREYFSQF